MLFDFAIRKIISLLITLFLLASLSFFLLHLLPGSPFDEGRFVDPSIELAMRHKYGLDKPILEQYCDYFSNLVLKQDFGPSLKYPGRSVNEIIFDALQVSLILGLFAFFFVALVGITMGFCLALRPESLLSRYFVLFINIAISLPSFVIAGILILIFGIIFKILPVALWEGPQYAILPILTLSISPLAYIAKITQTTIASNLSKPFVKTLLAKGLSDKRIFLHHILPNSILPILVILGPIMASLITGSFVVEYVFALPGMGKYFVTAFINRDYFLVIAVVIIFALILIGINTLIDFCALIIDPRRRD